MQQKLLEGTVMEPEQIEDGRLRAQIENLEAELAACRDRNADLQFKLTQAGAATVSLRKKLKPFYDLLRVVFGELDAIAPEAEDEASAVTPKNAAIWESWKQKLGTSAARIIAALQEHKDLNTTQLVIVAKMDRRTINNAIYKINQAGLIDKNAGRFSLKQF